MFSKHPVVTVRAAYTKNGNEATVPLPSELADVLRPYLAGRGRQDRVWPGSWARRRRGAFVLRRDLAEGAIPYRDDRGRVFDFHSLRKQYITSLCRGQVDPKTAQTLARHSSITLTMDVYAEAEEADRAAAVRNLRLVS